MTGMLVFVATTPAHALPNGGQVVGGQAVISGDASTLTITQSTERGIINWGSFDIAQGERVFFQQPSASSVTLNRVTGSQSPSQILGSLTANGTVMLINPNGVFFGPNSLVNVGSLVVTSSDLPDERFMAGDNRFDIPGKPEAGIVNEGTITVADAGLAAFVAPNVVNDGLIQARLGKVQLASGDAFTLDLYGDGLVNLQAGPDIGRQMVSNSGVISANGGKVTLTAAAAQEVVDSVINMDGIIEATSIGEVNGEIVIFAEGSNAVAGNDPAKKGQRQGSSTVLVSGLLDASGRNPGENGGKITVTGDNIALLAGTIIDASGHTGHAGTTSGKAVSAYREGSAGGDIRIGGDYLGGGDTPTAKNLYVDSGSLILNDALFAGDAGRTIFWSDGTTYFYGNVFARALGGLGLDTITWGPTPGGNAGDGGFVETSGYEYLDAAGYVNLSPSSGSRGTYFLDPTDITIYGNVDPTFQSTDSSINLASSLQLWLDASDASKVTLTYSTDGLSSATATGTSGTNTITTSSDVSSSLAVGARIRIGAAGSVTTADTLGTDTYTIASISGTTVTTTETLTSTYSGSTLYRGLVSQLTDKSGQGNNATQSTAANMPIWVTNAQNGSAVMKFTSSGGISSSQVLAGSFAQSSSYSFFSTVKTATLNSNEHAYFASGGPATPGIRWAFTADNAAASYNLGWAGTDSSVQLGSLASASNTLYQRSYIKTSTGWTIYNSGSQVSTVADSSSPTGTFQYQVGSEGVNGYGFNGNVSDIIVYNTNLSSTPRYLVEQYQSGKWDFALTPPGTGATEVAKATASDGYSLFTTRYLERLSQSADIALQATNNITLDLQGDTLDFSTAGRSLTLTAGNQITTASAGAITMNGGDIALTGTNGIVLNHAYTFNSGGGDITLNNATTLGGNQTFNTGSGTLTFGGTVNGGYDLTATAGTFDFSSALGGTTPLSTVSLTSTNGLTLPSISASSILARTTGASSDITIPSGVVLTASNSGNALTLASAHNFINNAGSGALSASNGRWVIYSTSPADDTPGGLSAGQTIQGSTYDSLPPASITEPIYSSSQNTWLYSTGGIVTITALDQAVTYGTAPNSSATLGTTFSFSCSDGCSSSVVTGGPGFSFTGGSGTGGSGNYNAGSWTITPSGVTVSNGYTINYLTGTLTVNPLTISINGVTADNKVYDGTTAATLGTGSASLSGVVAGDTVNLDSSSASGSFADKNVGSGKSVTASGFAVSGGDSGNYLLSQPAGLTADITAKGLTITGVTASNKVYDGTTADTLSTGSASLSGLIAGDTVNLDSSSASGSFADKNVGTGKAVTASGFSINGAGSGNYSLNQPAGLTANITAKQLTATVTANNKVYDGTTAGTGSVGSLNGIIAGDTVNLTGTDSYAFSDKNVGTGKTVVVSGLSLAGADAGNYSLATLTGTADITAKLLSILGVMADNKVYDGTTTATLDTGSASLSGVIGGDTVSLASGSASGSFADKNVGTSKSVTASGFSIAGADSGNYSLSQPAGLTADITAKQLTASVTADNKVYDGTTAGTGSVGSLNGIIAGDTVNLTGTDSYAFSDKNVGMGKTVTVSGLSLAGADAGNYSLASLTSTADITAKQLTASVTADNKVYDGTTTGTGSVGSLSGIVAGDTVNLTGTDSYAFSDKNVGTSKTVTVSGLSLAGADAGNYSLAALTGTADINAKGLTITGVTASNKTYDGTTADTLSTGSASLSGLIAGDTVNLDSSSAAGSFADKNVGTGKSVTASGFAIAGADSGNYSLSQPAGLTADITAKALTITGVTASNKVYDGTTADILGTGSASLSGLVAGDTVNLDSGSASGAFADKNVGSGKSVTASGFTIAGADSGNYSLSQPAGLTADITAKGLTITGVTASNKVYDGTTAATLDSGSASLSGVVAGDTVSLDSGSASGFFADKNVGSGKAVTASGFAISGADSGNYSLNQPAGLTADITAKLLSILGVTASDKTYDGTTSATLDSGSASLSGLVAGDTVNLDSSSVSGSFSDKNAGTGKSVTASGFAISGADSGNYSLSQPAGLTADVTAKSLTATVTANNKVYDGTTTGSGSVGSLSGIVAGDTVNLTGTDSYAFADKNVGTGKTVAVSGLSLAGADAGNYSLATLTGTADITAKLLSILGVMADNKVYDGTTTATLDTGSASLSGVIGGDTVSLDSGSASGSFAGKNVGSGKAVTASGFAISGGDSGNYLLSQPAGLTADITAKGLTITGVTASSKVYDGTTADTLSTGSASLFGIVAGDTVNLDSSSAAGAFADKNVGTGKSVTASGFSITGADSGNYSLSQPAGLTADITAKGLTITGVTASNKVYDGTTADTLDTGSASLSGLIAGDTVNLDSGSAAGSFADKTVGTGKSVTASGFSISGADSANYTVDQPTGLTADISAKSLTITGVTANNKTYDGTTADTLTTGSASLSGVVAGDTVNLDSSSATGSFADKNVGTGKSVTGSGFSIAGADSGNYSLTQPTGLTADITAKQLTATVAANDKVYDGTTAATGSVGSLSGIVAGDTVNLTGTESYAFADKNVGTGKTVTVSGLSLAGADSGNYSLASLTGTADIAAKQLTASLTGTVSKTYDGTADATLAAGNYSLSGVVAGDTVSLNNPTSGSYDDRNVSTAKTVSVNGLTLSGADATNYTLASTSISGAVGTITAKLLSILGVTPSNKVYDGTTAASLDNGSASLSGVVGGDMVSLDSGSASGSFADKNVGTGKSVTASGFSISGVDSGNYTMDQPSGLTADITAKSLTISGVTGSNKVYDGTTAATLNTSSASLSGLVGGDTVSLDSGSASGFFADKNVGSGKGVTASGFTISGADSGNYSLGQPSGLTANITAKQLTASLTGTVSKTYDGSTVASLAASNYSLLGVIGGDTVFLNKPVLGTYDTKDVGTGKTVFVNGLALLGADGPNYSLVATSISGSVGRINEVTDTTSAATATNANEMARILFPRARFEAPLLAPLVLQPLPQGSDERSSEGYAATGARPQSSAPLDTATRWSARLKPLIQIDPELQLLLNLPPEL